MQGSVKRLLEVYEVVEQIAVLLWILLYDDSTIEYMFYRSSAWSKTCLLLCHQFLSLGFETVENNSEDDLARMTG